jgi:hypothetical protein
MNDETELSSSRSLKSQPSSFPEIKPWRPNWPATLHYPDPVSLVRAISNGQFVFHPVAVVIAVWTGIGTIGDPSLRCGNLSMMYFTFETGPSMSALRNCGMKDVAALGIPSRRQLVQSTVDQYYYYSQSLLLPQTVSPLLSTATVWRWSSFYLAFLFFKNCVIVQSVPNALYRGSGQ